jgi:long-chain acyl-CoA synthetase
MSIAVLSRAFHADVRQPRYEERLASVGVAQSTVEVRIADADDRTVPAGELGEVLVRGDTVMTGYWNDPTATAEALRGGWLHTGDIGVMDDDGYITLKDRSKDVIISGGSNIYPREVEEVLLRHPAVAEASVIGRQDPEWGEAVVAFVACAPGRTVSAAELDALCIDNIARYKRPKVYRFLESLPKSHIGKTLKTELRKLLADESPPS